MSLRAEQARAALEAGAHVLAEKPFTVLPADAWALARLARDRARTLMLCYAWNEMGIVERARQLLVDDGGVGRVEHVSVVMSSVDGPIASPPRAETWSDPAVSGGGYGQGQLTHGIGLLSRLLPARAREVLAFTSTSGGAAVELHDAIALRFDDGSIGTISGASRGQADDVTLELTDDDVTWSFGRVVDRFVDLAAGRTTEVRSPAEFGARVVEVLEAMARSAATGHRASIEPG